MGAAARRREIPAVDEGSRGPRRRAAAAEEVISGDERARVEKDRFWSETAINELREAPSFRSR